MKKIISASAEYIAKLEAQASARREMILNTPNMEIPAGSTVYYISANGDDARDGRSPETAWRSTARLKKEELPYGSYVCFERGGIYRGQVGVVYDGVTYTAYGEGPKPEIRGSEYDGAVFGSWTEVEKNIWRYSILFDRDVGMLVMNQGEEHGMKIILDYGGECVRERVSGKVWEGYTSLDENCEFFHDLGGMAVRNPDGGYLYLYCDRGNPAKVWNSIEFVMHGSIFPNMRKNDVTFDNLCLKYSNFGISSGGNNLRVQNCEIGWIGGALMRYSDSGYAIRYGNGVEIYGGCRNFVCENNWVYQCYDAGLTQQYSAGGTNDLIMDGVYYIGNLIEKCVYSIEYFLGKPDEGTSPTRYMANICIRDNIMLDAGYGFGDQRPEKTSPAHIKGWDHMNTLRGEFVIENNVFLRSDKMMIHTGFKTPADAPAWRGNIFVQTEGGQWGRCGVNPTELLMYNEASLSDAYFLENSFFLTDRAI